MLSVYSDDHRLHFGQSELVDGKLQPCFEMPSRADTVLARVKSQNLGEVIAPKDFGREPLLRIHDAAYLDFLQGAWARWTAEGHSGDLVSTTFPGRRLRRDGPIPTALMGELGYYSFDTEAPITAGTWQAIYSSAQVALTAQEHMRQGARSAFALCRPPGHHAGGDFMGGYCFLNNAAIATQAFLDQGARRVAIL
ncbi:acetylpolyamine amidohydrolase AphA, partial [Pseudomonas aeruginosa]